MELITRGCDSRKQTRMIDLCFNDLVRKVGSALTVPLDR
jgi:hypothetical protein